MLKDKSNTVRSFTDMVASNNITRVANLCLAGAICFASMSMYFKDSEVIVIPEQNFFGELSVQGDKVNQNYQQAWAYSISSLIGNINPQNIGFVKKIMMRVLSPQLQVQIEPMLERQADMIKLRDIRQVFIADDLMHEPETDLITIWGQKITFIAGEPKADTKWSYEFKIKAQNGRPKITHIDQYPGTPRKRNQVMKDRNDANPTTPASQPYYDNELEIGVLEAAADLKAKEEAENNTAEQN